MNPDLALAIINGIGLLTFTGLVGAVVALLVRRGYTYMVARQTLPVILRRDLVLFTALSVVGLESLLLRATGTVLEGWARVFFVAHWDFVLVAALVYWVRVELNDIDNPSVK